MIPYEIVEHTADVGFRAWGETAAELFANAARALMEIAAGDAENTRSEQITVAAAGHDYESVMVNWLEEILYLFDTGRFAPTDFMVERIGPESMSARLIGEVRDPARHPWKVIVKAITYHQIEVVERNGRWQASIFVDI